MEAPLIKSFPQLLAKFSLHPSEGASEGLTGQGFREYSLRSLARRGHCDNIPPRLTIRVPQVSEASPGEGIATDRADHRNQVVLGSQKPRQARALRHRESVFGEDRAQIGLRSLARRGHCDKPGWASWT